MWAFHTPSIEPSVGLFDSNYAAALCNEASWQVPQLFGEGDPAKSGAHLSA